MDQRDDELSKVLREIRDEFRAYREENAQCYKEHVERYRENIERDERYREEWKEGQRQAKWHSISAMLVGLALGVIGMLLVLGMGLLKF